MSMYLAASGTTAMERCFLSSLFIGTSSLSAQRYRLSIFSAYSNNMRPLDVSTVSFLLLLNVVADGRLCYSQILRSGRKTSLECDSIKYFQSIIANHACIIILIKIRGNNSGTKLLQIYKIFIKMKQNTTVCLLILNILYTIVYNLQQLRYSHSCTCSTETGPPER